MAAARALDGLNGFGHRQSVLLDRRVRARLLAGLGGFLPHPTHVATHGRAGGAQIRLLKRAGKPCLAASLASVQCDYFSHIHHFTYA